MGPVPVHDLHGTGRNPEKIFVQTPIDLSQPLEGHPRRSNGSLRHLHRIAMVSIKLAQVLFAKNGEAQLAEMLETGNPYRRGIEVHQQFVSHESKPPGRT
jgi:hypothetical protein